MLATKRTNEATVTALDRQRAAVNPAAAQADQLRLLLHENMRLRQELDALRQQIATLEAEADRLAARAGARRQAVPPPTDAATVNGRQVVNQTEAARKLNVKQYQISRWVAAGHFELVRVGSRRLIYADTLHHPAPKSRKRHAKADEF